MVDQKHLISIVVPTYREVSNLSPLVRRIDAAMRGTGFAYEVVIIDDNSNDGTEELVTRLAEEGFPVKLYVRLQDRGLGTAVVFGFDRAAGDVLVCMDADLSHPPEMIPHLIAPLFEPSSAEFVIGSRYVQGGAIDKNWGISRWANSYVAVLLSRPLFRSVVEDPMTGFFAFKASVLKRCTDLSPIGYKVGLEIMLKCVCNPVREVPITFQDRAEGQSKLTLRERLNYLNHLSRLYDFTYPQLSPSVKYAVVILVGYLAALAFLPILQLFSLDATLRLWIDYLPALIVSAIAYWRYIRFNRQFIESRAPYLEFAGMSAAEFLTVGIVLRSLLSHSSLSIYRLLPALIAMGAVARFILRKIFGHDLRGPAEVRKQLRRFQYQNKEDLVCLGCGNRRFTLPFISKFPWLLKCPNCSLMFAYPQPTDEELDAIYDSHYFDEWGGPENTSALRAMKEHTFELQAKLATSIHSIASMLDIGCGIGHTLDVGTRLGWEVLGIDMNDAAVQEIAKRHPQKVLRGTLETIPANRQYDLICMFDVLDHVRYPMMTLEHAKAFMRDSSLLMISTTDASSGRARLWGKNWFHIHKAHLWYFTKPALRYLLRQQGYRILALQDAQKVYTLRYILGIISTKTGSGFIRILSKGFLRILPSFLLDYILPAMTEGIFVIAQKQPSESPVVSKVLHIESGSP